MSTALWLFFGMILSPASYAIGHAAMVRRYHHR